jgi:2-octaprenyl-6-methoxyphenol hydroxylase
LRRPSPAPAARALDRERPLGERGPSFDERTTALGNASRRILGALGLWDELAPEAGPIRSIHVSDAGHFGFARLEAREQGVEAFGYVLANRALGAALWNKLSGAAQLTLCVPGRVEALQIAAAGVHLGVAGADGEVREYRARLVVGADGAHSQVRAAAGIGAAIEDYEQVALVANVASDQPHDERAFERFTPHGPLAVLPLHNGTLAVVGLHAGKCACCDWMTPPSWHGCVRLARRALHAPVPAPPTPSGSRARPPAAARTVLIGNARRRCTRWRGRASTRLSDAAMLAEVIAAAPPRCRAHPSCYRPSPRGARTIGAAWCVSPMAW